MDTQTLAIALNSMAREMKKHGAKLSVDDADALVNSIIQMADELHERGVDLVTRSVNMRKGASFEIPVVATPLSPLQDIVTWVPEY